MSRSSKRLFFKKFIKQPLLNASITPSSQTLARLMVQDIDWSIVDTVIEFGPGTGVFTEHIISSMKSWTKLVLLEFDRDYCELLIHQFGNQVTVIQWDVQDFSTIIDQYQLKPDFIISWLPYYPFEWERWAALIYYIKSLISEWCVMRWFSYSPWRFYKTYDVLHPRLVDYTLSCIPPAFVYEMK